LLAPPFRAILYTEQIDVFLLLLAAFAYLAFSRALPLFTNRQLQVTIHALHTGVAHKGIPMAVLTLSEKLDQLGTRYDDLTNQLSTQELVSDSSRFQKVAKQHAELAEIVAKHREYKQIEKDLAGAHQMFLEADDQEMKQLAHDEEKQLIARKENVERELKLLLLPKDPLDEKSVIVEIRAGTGGDEAGIFAGDLYRMYSRFAEIQGWKVEVSKALRPPKAE